MGQVCSLPGHCEVRLLIWLSIYIYIYALLCLVHLLTLTAHFCAGVKCLLMKRQTLCPLPDQVLLRRRPGWWRDFKSSGGATNQACYPLGRTHALLCLVHLLTLTAHFCAGVKCLLMKRQTLCPLPDQVLLAPSSTRPSSAANLWLAARTLRVTACGRTRAVYSWRA